MAHLKIIATVTGGIRGLLYFCNCFYTWWWWIQTSQPVLQSRVWTTEMRPTSNLFHHLDPSERGRDDYLLKRSTSQRWLELHKVKKLRASEITKRRFKSMMTACSSGSDDNHGSTTATTTTKLLIDETRIRTRPRNLAHDALKIIALVSGDTFFGFIFTCNYFYTWWSTSQRELERIESQRRLELLGEKDRNDATINLKKLKN